MTNKSKEKNLSWMCYPCYLPDLIRKLNILTQLKRNRYVLLESIEHIWHVVECGVDHFREAKKMLELGSKAKRKVKDYMFTRYACYLIAQNGDPRKEEIAFVQSYFDIQTRKQELIEERIALVERTEVCGRMHESEKRLSQNIYECGVDDAGFGRIRSKGDQVLFGGYTTQKINSKQF